MKRIYYLPILLISGFFTVNVLGQDDGNLVPRNVEVFASRSIPPYAIIGWPPVEDAASYIVRLYRSSDNSLFQEIRNVMLPFVNVTGLESGTNYTVTAAAAYFNENGRRMESEESEPEYFRTEAACMGRRVRVPCTAHCVSTCDDPDPVCSRECVPGCGCPANLPIWFRDGCIPRVLCPPPTGSPVVPRNVQVERGIANGEVIVVWEPIENAAGYVVQVRRTDADNTVVRRVESSFSLVPISGLNPNEVYIFSVTVILKPQNDPESEQRNAILPPENIFDSAITNTSFRVQWTPRSDAVRYVFVLYDENQTTPLYSNDKIAGTIINIDSLAPGTIYYYSVAAARARSDPGIRSPLARVRTKGTSPGTGFMHAAVVVDIPQSTSAPTTTTTTTTRLSTACLQEYESIRQYYAIFPDEDRETGPQFPNCDSEGRYVTRLCEQTRQNECFCIQPESGEKLVGSDFGGSNSPIQLNCDQFGMLSDQVENLRIDDVTSTSISLMWDAVDGVVGYVVTTADGIQENRTIFVDDNVQVTLTNLIPGQRYLFGVYALNVEGWSSPINSNEVTTLAVETPQNLQVTRTTASSVTITWDRSLGADQYEVSLILAETNEIIKSEAEIIATSYTFANLTASISYRIELRAIAIQYESANEEKSTIYRTEPASVEVTLEDQCRLPPLDLLYVIDSSANTGWLNLQVVKRFLKNITLEVPAVNQIDGTRISVVKYYRVARASFSFARFNSTSSVLLGLDWLSYNGGSTRNISRALDYVRQTYFSSSSQYLNRPRPNALSIVMFFSVGGPGSNLERTRRAAASLGEVTNVVSVGVEGSSDDTLLDAIASKPDLKVVAPSFADLSSMDIAIRDKFCSMV